MLDEAGAIVGLLDIAKCLYEAISALEHVQGDEKSDKDGGAAMAGAMASAMKKAAGGKGNNKAQMLAMQRCWRRCSADRADIAQDSGDEHLVFV